MSVTIKVSTTHTVTTDDYMTTDETYATLDHLIENLTENEIQRWLRIRSKHASTYKRLLGPLP